MDYHFDKEIKSLSIFRYVQELFHHRATLLLLILEGTLHFKIYYYISAIIIITVKLSFQFVYMYNVSEIILGLGWRCLSRMLKCCFSLSGIMQW